MIRIRTKFFEMMIMTTIVGVLTNQQTEKCQGWFGFNQFSSFSQRCHSVRQFVNKLKYIQIKIWSENFYRLITYQHSVRIPIL